MFPKIKETNLKVNIEAYEQESLTDDKEEPVIIRDSDMIRVLLKNKTSNYWDKVYVKLQGDYDKISISGGSTLKKSKSLLKFVKQGTNKQLQEDECVILKPKEEDCRFFLTDKSGKKLSLGYRGSLRLYLYKEGYVIVNELPLKEYLYGVVPSEMPSKYEMEALKAQAVCARCYAYKQLEKASLWEYYAHVDDTTTFQVYNKSKDKKRSRNAVDETLNQVLLYHGKITNTYYYSTSCGSKQSYELWGLKGENYGYLQADVISQDAISSGKETSTLKQLSTEKAFQSFIDEPQDSILEKDYRYFRWSGTYDYIEHQEELKQAIRKRKLVDKGQLDICDVNGEECDLDDLVDIKDMKVVKRSSGGGITELIVYYKQGYVALHNEYTIRYCLGALKPTITLADRSVITPNLLPSSCFYLKEDDHGSVTIQGGGFGHGLGMSQNGAQELAKLGYTYKDILLFFYNGVQLEEL